MKNIIISISVLFMVLLVGCSDFEGSVNRFNNKLRGIKETEANDSISIKLKEDALTERTSDLPIDEEAPKEEITQKEIDVCEFKDEGSEANDLCYLKFSEEYPDNFYCNYFVDETLKNTCRTDWAVKKNDTYYCRIQPIDSAIECYNQFFGIRTNTDICTTIMDLKLKKCLSEVNQTTDIQERELFCKGEDKTNSWNDCMWRIAVAMRDKDWCVRAYNDDECFLTYAKSTLDQTTCEKLAPNINKEDLKDLDYDDEEIELYSDSIIAAEGRDNLILMGECYNYIAVKRQDEKICDKIPKVKGGKPSKVSCKDDVS